MAADPLCPYCGGYGLVGAVSVDGVIHLSRDCRCVTRPRRWHLTWLACGERGICHAFSLSEGYGSLCGAWGLVDWLYDVPNDRQLPGYPGHRCRRCEERARARYRRWRRVRQWLQPWRKEEAP